MLTAKRLLTIRRVVRRHGLLDILLQLPISSRAKWMLRIAIGGKKSSENRARRLRLALEELGPVFVKLGQAMSTRPDLLPTDIALELTSLQDDVPAFDGKKAVEIIKQSFGDSEAKIFLEIDHTPLASASVAQVHAATLKPEFAITCDNGSQTTDVVVKVIRPDIEPVINKDLAVMQTIAKFLDKNLKDSELIKPKEIVDEYEITIRDELDLRREAANCSQMGHNFVDSDIIYVPSVNWDLCRKNVLVMERIYGTSIRDKKSLTEQGIDLAQLANDGVEVFFKQAFEDNFFHGDMHPGNIFVSDDGHWIAVDFGIMGTLNNEDKYYIAENLMGFFKRDYRRVARAHLRAGWIDPECRIEDFETAIRTVCEPNFAKPIEEISFGTVLVQMLETARRFKMPVQPRLMLLYKTLLNIEGLGRQLYPQLNLWDSALPFLEKWMKQQLDPKLMLEEFVADWPRLRRLLPRLPELLEYQLEQLDKAKNANKP